MGPGVYSRDGDKNNHGDVAPVCILTQWSGNHSLGLRATFVLFPLCKMPECLCLEEVESVVSCGKKQPELLFTLWTASWVKIVLAAWSRFKPHCRKRSFLEEKIFLPTYRFAYGHFPRGEEERQSHAKVKPIPFSTPRPRKAHQNPGLKYLPLTARSGSITDLQVT